MVSPPPDRVTITAAQLADRDLPPVCAMTGQPAETWRRFRFHTAPGWSFVFLFLICVGIGFFVSAILIYIVSRRAAGYLPLTAASSHRLGHVTRFAIVTIAISIVMGIVAAFLGASVTGVMLFDTGILVFVFGSVVLQTGLQITYPLVGPRARVMKPEPGQPGPLVELRKVHPAFVAAVNEMHAARAAQPPMAT